jgi:hypothetical protein
MKTRWRGMGVSSSVAKPNPSQANMFWVKAQNMNKA